LRGVVSTGLVLGNDLGVGSSEGSRKVGLELGVASVAGDLVLAARLGPLGLEGSLAGNDAGLGGLLLGGALSLVGRVESLHKSVVLEGVLLLFVVENDVGLDLSELGLNLIGVDDSGEVSDVHAASGELISTLLDTLDTVGTENVVEGLESVLGEDDESAEVTTGSKLEEVKSVHVADINAGQVASSSLHGGVGIAVDDERTLAEHEAGVPHLGLTSASALLGASAEQVSGSASILERGEEVLGALNVEVVNNEGKLGDIIDSVTTGLDEGSAGGGSQSRGDGVSVLVDVGLSVPSSPDLKGSEHATLTAHVTESTLTGSVGA
jgi:hypothetical protein